MSVLDLILPSCPVHLLSSLWASLHGSFSTDKQLNSGARLHLNTKQLLQHHLWLGNFFFELSWVVYQFMQWQLPSMSSVFPPSPAQTMRGRLKTELWSSLQDYRVAVGFAECSSWSCLSCSDHPPSMISSLLFQSSYSAPMDLLLLPLLPHYISAPCSISLFPWTSR